LNKLIKNELTKLIKKKSLYIMLIILIIFMIINNILYSRAYSNKGDKYIEDAETQYEQLLEYKESLESLEKMSKEEEESYNIIIKQMEKNQYIIDNKQNVDAVGDNRFILRTIFAQYDIFIIIYIIMIAGTIMSEEFNKGTIKLLLIKPYSRTQIFLAKFIACIIVLLCSALIMVLLQVIIGGLILDFNSLTVPIVEYNSATQDLQFINLFAYIGLDFLARLPIYLILLALSFACSTILLNTATSIVIPILVYLFSGTIEGFLNGINAKWMRFIITLNWNFETYLFGRKPEISAFSLGFSVFICILYFVIIIGAAYYNFRRRDIKNI